ncbi:MAG TPA: hypothetical protein DEA97_08715 [Bacteroidales bacterium]|nr:hypothetical protein [Bacteroidales bacterium]
MKKRNFNQRLFLIITCLFVVSGLISSAQTAGSYAFVPTTGTYTSIAAGTNVDGIEVDDATVSGIPIGFTFTYCGTGYTTASVSSNGWLSFQTTTYSGLTNDLDNDANGIRPLLAPLWDDMDGASGTAKYETTGAAGSRIFTMQWENWEWNYSAAGAVISFQVKLYEADNHIEFVYRQDANVVNSGSASIGICDGSLGATHFLSLDGTGAAPGVSSTVETITLATKPATGQIYRFNPGSPMAYSSCTTTQTVTSSVYTGTTNNQVIGVQVVTTGSTSPLTINQLSFNTTGTSNPAVDIQNAKLFSTGTSSTFAMTTQVGTTVAAPSGAFTISPAIALQGGTNYFWLTYDVKPGATPGNVIDAQCTSIQVASTNYTPSVTNPAGTRTITLTPAFNGTFEGGGSFIANGMTEINGAQTNKWVVGTVTDNGGAYSAYVSQDAGVNNTYNVSSTSVTHFYFDYTFPVSAPIINLSFDWHNYGESCCDYLIFSIVPTTTTPVEGVLLGTGQISANLNVQSTWQTSSYTLDPALAGTTQRIVFTWRNDGSLGTDPPAAVDNIIISTSDNDDCADATVLAVNSGSCSYSTYGNSFATSSGIANGACGTSTVKDVWFRVTVPASGNLIFQADAIDFNDGAMAIYTGNCGALTEIDCDDDNGPGLMPRIESTGLTPGATIFIRFWEVSGTQTGNFNICVFEPAQILSVDPSTYTPTELVQDVLITGCLTASNITYTGAASGIGYFDGSGAPTISFLDGIILGSGSVDGAEGPNNSDSYTLDNAGAGDADLNALSGGTTQDAAILEFDFVPSSNNVTFDFLFASEEYNEYVGLGFNDVFGFFISGPGISGPYTNSAINIALIPATSTPVAIDNVNNTTNPAYYNDNDYGDVSPLNNQVQFDGYTVPLTAQATLVACQTYHIKLAVADVFDGLFDSWVLLEANSFSSGNGAVLDVVNATGTTDSYEGCQSNIVFTRVDPSQTSTAISFTYSVSGTATYNVDYTIPGYPNATIPVGSASVSIPITAIVDGLSENETIIITLTGGCPCNPTVQTSTINLHDFTAVTGEITSPPTTICQGSSTTLSGIIYTGNYVGYRWYIGGTLIGTTQNITVSPLTTTTYTLTLRDSCNNTVNDNVTITVNTPSTAPTSVTASPSTICSGATTTLTVNGGALGTGATWHWYTGSCGGTAVGTGASITQSPTTTTTYYVRAEGSCGNTTCASNTVTVNPLPTLFTVGGTGSYCVGGTGVAVTLSGSTSGVNYTLYLGGVATGTTLAGTGAALNFGNQLVGTYTVVATNATTSCTRTMTGSAVITTNPLPTLYTVGGTGAYCSGGTGVAVTLSGSQVGVNYTLYLGGVATGTTLAGTGAALNFGNQTAGTYTVVATNATTSCTRTMTGSAVISVNPLPTLYTVGGTGAYCVGGTGVAVTLSGSNVGINYTLYLGGVSTGTTIAGTGSPLSFGNQLVGTYTVVATNATTSCTATMTGSAVITTNPLPTLYTVGGTGSYCVGGTGVAVTLSGSQVGVNYTLYLGGVATGTTLAGTGAALNFGNQLVGTYTVVATNATTSCTRTMTGSAVITTNPLPTLYNVGGTGAYCSGGTGVAVTLSGSQVGVNYTLYLGGVATGTTLAGTGAALNFGNQLAGTYTVVATNASTSCTNTMTGSAIISVNPLPTLFTVGGTGAYCVGGTGVAVTLSGSSVGINYTLYLGGVSTGTTLSGTGSSLSFGNQLAGTYTVVATNSTTLCTATMTGSAVITTNPLPTQYVVNGTAGYCAGGTGVAVTLSDSDVGINYQLYQGGVATGIIISGTGSAISFGNQLVGTYTVVATNSTTSCTNTMTGSAVITINPLPSVTATATPATIPNGGTSSLTSSPSGAYTYSWSPAGSVVSPTAQNTSTTALSATTVYTVTVTNSTTGCSATGTTTVNVTGGVLSVTTTPSPSGTICNGGSILITANPSGGSGSYTYLWSAGPSVNTQSQTVSPASTTTYFVTVTDAVTSGTVVGSVLVNVNPLPTLFTVGGTGSYCVGGAGVAVTLSGSQLGVNYTLYLGGVATATTLAGTGAALNFGNQFAGTYTVVATNATTSCTVNMTGSAVITTNPLPTAFNVGGTGAYCSGGTGIAVTLSGSTSGVNYTLYLGGVATGTTLAGTGAALNFGNQLAGTYTVVATNATTSCVNNMTGSAVISINPLPTQYNVLGTAAYCSGGSGMPVSLSNSDIGINYTLYLGGVTTGLTVSGTGSSISFGNQLAGTYTIVATNSTTSCTSTMTGSAVISINPLPTLYNVLGTGAYCTGGTGVAVSLSDSDPGINYQLYLNGVATATILPGTGSALSYGNQLVGIYTVVATNGTTSCTSTMTGNATITINPLPTQYNVLGSGSYCAGGTGVVVSLSGSSVGINYTLYLGGVSTGTTLPGTGAALSYGNQLAGTYTVVATNATTGCVNNMTGSAIITINPLPTQYVVGGTGSYCIGASGVNVTLSNSEVGISYQLYAGGTPTGIFVSGTGSAISFGNQLAGTYTVVATNTTTLCTNTMTGSAVITQNALPVVNFSGIDAAYCEGTAVDLFTGNHAPGGSFSISAGGTLIDNANGTASFTPTTGSFSVTYTYTDGNGCVNSQVQSTIVHALPVVSFSGLSSPYCEGDAVDNLTGSPVGSGVFTGTDITDNGDGTATFNPITPGSFVLTFTYTDANGCVNHQDQTAVVNALPVVSFAGLDTEYCSGEPVVTLTGNSAPLGSFAIAPATTFTDNMNGTASFSPLTGSYSITYTYTNGVGCTDSQTQTTTVHALPVVSISGLNPAYCDESTPFTITGFPTDANGIFTSTSADLTDNNNGTATYDPNSTGNFSVTYTYTDANTCVNYTTQYTTINNLPPVSLTGLETEYCYGSAIDTVISNQSGGTFTGTGVTDLGNGSAQFNPATVGVSTINYQFTDINGCTSSTSQSTTVNPLPQIDNIATTDVWDCSAPNGTITITASAGTLPFQYSVNGGLSYYPTGVFTDLNSVNYNIIVVDDNGCIATGTTSIGNAVGPVIDSISIVNVSCFGGLTGEIVIYSSTGVNYSIDNGTTIVPGSLFTGLPVGTYNLIVEDIGKCQISGIAVITEPTDLTASFTETSDITCYGYDNGSAIITPAGGVSPYSFIWDDASATTDSSVTNLSPDIYYHVTVTDNNGCNLVDSVMLNQPSELATNIISVTNVSCFGYSDGNATVNITGGTPLYDIEWSIPTEILPLVEGLSANIWYFVTVTDANGCTVVDSIMLTEPAAIDLSDISSTASTCGDTNGTATVNPIGGTPSYTYLWSNADITATADGLIPGPATVTVTDANSCTATATVTVANEGGGSTEISVVNNVLCYNGNTAVIFTEMTGGTAPYTYNWSGGIIHTSAELSDTLTGLVAGTYFVDVYDANNCFSTDTIVVTQPNQLTDSLVITNVQCNGESTGSAQVFVSGGTLPYTYAWSNTFNGANNIGLPAGGYSVTITDGNGCVIGHTNISILQPATGLSLAVTVNQTIECAGETGSLSAEVTGGSPAYTYVWDASTGSQVTATAINLPTGSYYITVFDAGGCSAAATQVLTSPEAMLLVMDEILDASCQGNNDGSISISVYEGTGAYAYLWSNGSVEGDISGLVAGEYFVTITDENGCELIDTIHVSEENFSCYDLIIPSAFTPNDDGVNDTWEIGDAGSVERIEIEIYNRWGQMIFNFAGTGAEYAETENQWDGKYNNVEMPHGAYVFILKVNDDEPLNGTVTIIR